MAAEMPSLIPAELSVWKEDRQKDLEGRQHGRPQAGCRFEFHVDTGSRAHARDDPTGTFRRRVSVSHSPGRGVVRTLLRVPRTSRCIARYGHRGTRVGEAAHPGPSRRLRRVGDERNVAPRLSTLATVVDNSVSDEMPLLRVFTGDHGTIDRTLLDSLAEDLGATEQDNELLRDTIPARPANREVHECSSAGSESCWGGKEDIADDEVPERGALPLLASFAQAVPAPHVVGCDRVAHHAEHEGRQSLRLIRHSQRETVAASSVNSSAEGVRGQCGPQDSERTPQSVQVARLGDVASLVGRPEVFPLTGDDSDQFGDGGVPTLRWRAMGRCPIQSPTQLLRWQFRRRSHEGSVGGVDIRIFCVCVVQ